MSKNLYRKTDAKGTKLFVTRYCVPESKGTDMVRVGLFIHDPKGNRQVISLNRKEWAELSWMVDKGFTELPE